MSNDTTPTPVPLPPVFEIPPEAIARWDSLPDRELVLRLTKSDIDQLMLGLRREAIAQMHLGDALRAATNDDKETANEFFIEHQLRSREAYSNFNKFIEIIMTKASTHG